MNRKIFFTLFLSLTMMSLVFGALPLAAAGTLNAPVGLTETFTPTPLVLVPPTPTHTPVPTNTAVPTAMPTNTAVPAAPAATETPTAQATADLVPTATPTVPTVVGLPDTGGAAPQGGVSAWLWLWIAGIIGGLGALGFGINRRTLRPTRQ
ncbi:MAG: hypothetical protein KBG20_17055 [Caldilineaceae bacterium]|nr:hypothetical protein [Caldilineaceae bacterium]MBP8109928.1 hypothetical protein [Caldilineaceae bacterium]MBP8123988.1 hypothetical protein [Caldilineaceae bacterium]MBP9074017.1 hypothetical protein [Caldilineaceae bacterium]